MSINTKKNEKYNQIITLKDGRKLGYAEFGISEGKPVFYFHGHGSSRLEPKMYGFDDNQFNVRLISIDRPGRGFSDFKENRKILDWPDDVVEIADTLNIQKFAVLGGSGGCPYALVCALKIPERLTHCGIVSGLGPTVLGLEGMDKGKQKELNLAKNKPGLLTKLYKIIQKKILKMKDQTLEELKKTFQKRSKNLPEPDKKIMVDPDKIPLYVELMAEPFRQGIRGVIHDLKLLSLDWGFNLKEIPSSIKVFLWHGELDTSVPVRMGRLICEAIPNCTSKFYPNEAHISTAINHIEEILDALMS
ncbi:MAG: alpha/beta hydrolase [Promethearchaeota archaeon]|nr:MAG: alpha/beta hydrolase [Candidatus Lokiarchaeota archaeon]